ncbi:MAG TPA: 5'-3' exonuclease [Actinomycetales bacterium]|nr:5'-3' exonuclease [Actinomycetales bacterium]
MSRLMLLDSASLYFRAFFGVPSSVTAPDGSPVNAVRGFLDMVATLVTTHPPTRLVACWDDDWRPEFRVQAIPSYKAHRLVPGSAVVEESPEELTPQVPVIVDVLAALGVARVGHPGFEADDVMGTLAERAASSGTPVDVVTGDRDLFQLVDDQRAVRVLYTGKGVRNLDVVDQARLRARYDVASGRDYAEMAVLRGDPSDGLPGVPGIGEKTAAGLLRRFGGLAGLLDAVGDPGTSIAPGQRAKLAAAADYLAVAPTVVDVVLDVPVPDDLGDALPSGPADVDALTELADRWGLRSSINRVLAAFDQAHEAAADRD